MIAGDTVTRQPVPLLAWIIVVTLFTGLLLADGYLVATQLQGTALEKAKFVLRVLGLYGIGLGFIQSSAQLKSWSDVREMTSSNLAQFIRANLRVVTLPLNLAVVGLNKERLPGRATEGAMGFIGQALLIASVPAILVYVVLHLLAIMPVAYIAYAVSGAVAASITGAAGDVKLAATGLEGRTEISVKQVVESNPAAFKSFLVGIPSTALSFVMDLAGLV